MTPSKFSAKSIIRSTAGTVSKVLNFVSHPKIVIATALVACNIASFGLFNVSQVFAQKSQVPQEAMLMLEFPADTTLKSVIQNIKKELPSGNLNEISISNIGSQLDFEGQTQTFNKVNEDNLNAQQFVEKYPKSQTAFLKTVLALKQADEKNQDYESKEAIKPLINKYSKATLQKTLDKYKVKNPTISSINISGSLSNLTKLNAIAKNKLSAKSLVLIDIAKAQRQGNELKVKIDMASTQEEKDKIFQDEVSKILPTTQKQPILNLDSAKVQEVDNLKKTDSNGNIYIDKQELQSKLKLTNNQADQISEAMDRFNKISPEIKDGSSLSIQSVSQTNQLKIEENNQKELAEKLSDMMLVGIKANAANCYESAYVMQYTWSGVKVRGNSCYAQNFRNGFLYLTGGALLSFALIGTACILATVSTAGLGGFVCYILLSLITAKAFQLYLAGDAWYNKANQCNGWATVEIGYFISYKSVTC